MERRFYQDMIDMIGLLGDERQPARMLALAPHIIAGINKICGAGSIETSAIFLNCLVGWQLQ